MAPVETAWHQVIELVIVQAGEPVGTVRIGPYPLREGGFDLDQLFLGGFRRLRVQNPTFFAVDNFALPPTFFFRTPFFFVN